MEQRSIGLTRLKTFSEKPFYCVKIVIGGKVSRYYGISYVNIYDAFVELIDKNGTSVFNELKIKINRILINDVEIELH